MQEATELTRAIGGRVRRERTARGWTLDQLAGVSGVSRRMLINVEQGETNPSIGTLLRLGDALGIGLPALVEPPSPKPVRITRSGSGAVLWAGQRGGRAVLVVGTGPPDVLELWDWTLGPGDRYVSEAHAAGTREVLQVLQGAVVVEVAGQPVTLSVGDAVSFAGDAPHSYSDGAGDGARFSLAVFEPGVGSTSSSAGVARA